MSVYAFGGAGTFVFAYIVAPIAAAVVAALAYDAIILRDRQSMRPVDRLGSPEA